MNTMLLARKSGQVKRYHTNRVLNEETVAEHTFNVVNLLMLLTEGQASRELLLAGLTHDMGEYELGDIPSPTKKMLRGLDKGSLDEMEDASVRKIHGGSAFNPLTDYERMLLKLADCMDGLLKCREELRMGNLEIATVGKTYATYVHNLLLELGDKARPRQMAIECITLYNQARIDE